MKNPILLIAAVGCLVLPTITHADTPVVKNEKTRRDTAAAVAGRPPSNRVVYYISSETATGSLIPTVRRAYGGRIDSASSPAVYGLASIQQTGSLDVASALIRLDPSITAGRGR